MCSNTTLVHDKGREQTVMDPFDHSRCSFPIPESQSKEDEHRWNATLTMEQHLEILHWMLVARYGEAVVNAPMNRSVIEILSMEEFNSQKAAEFAKVEIWRAAHGWPSRMPSRGRPGSGE